MKDTMASLEKRALNVWTCKGSFLKILIKVTLPWGYFDALILKENYLSTRDGLKLTDVSHKLF